MKQNQKLIGIRFYISCILIMAGVLVVGSSMVLSNEGWIVTVNQGELLNINPNTTQWLTLKGRLNAVSLIEGKIAVYNRNDDGSWVETQRFGLPDILFSTFQVKDVNNDDLAEIIAGTVEPGFIYIYKFNEGQWDVFNYGKYVWSSITNIAVGNFGGTSGNNILVQNQEGSLYLLKVTNDSLDLIWKSPNVWRLISSYFVIDIDNDAKDEIMVIYKTGGIAILKMVNNSIISVWENYPWGKVLAVSSGDWDNDQQIELMIGTSQKITYFLGYGGERGYLFESQWSQPNYTIEKFIFNNNDRNRLLASDTAGKFHVLEYNVKNKQWEEDFLCQTGRIAQIISADPERILLWGINRKIIEVQAYSTKEIKLKYQNTDYSLSPPALFQNDILYLSPQALQGIPSLNLVYKNEKNSFLLIRAEKTIEISKKDLTVKVNGENLTIPEQPVIMAGELQLPISSYLKIIDLALTFDSVNKMIHLINPDDDPWSNI